MIFKKERLMEGLEEADVAFFFLPEDGEVIPIFWQKICDFTRSGGQNSWQLLNGLST